MIALIPTIGESSQLVKLLEVIGEEVEEVYLTVNDPKARLPNVPIVNVCKRINLEGSIYAGWNFGVDRAGALNTQVAILNDDIVLQPGALETASHLLRYHSRAPVVGLDYRLIGGDPHLVPASGSYRHGGLPGWAFIVDPRRTSVRFDEGFEWWYGDDDFFLAAEEQYGGPLAVAQGCWVQHQGEATAFNHSWTQDAKIRDRERFVERWGDR